MLLSTKKNFLSGLDIARGIPGRPPPLPRSITFSPKKGEIERESLMCSSRFVAWFFETRLCVWFQDTKSDLYEEICFSCLLSNCLSFFFK